MNWTLILGLSLILTHEIDAMAAREWRMLPGLSRLGDDLGQRVFLIGHVPLFAAVLWGLTGQSQGTWATAFDTFLIAHAVAHLLLHGHSENGFRRPDSWLLIAGAAFAGGADLWLRLCP
ncbi:MAG: hypothetical protein GY723_01010 [bacterium]|nr:hypothetical protein [bacterium]MCP5068737.1 hypothetical protein [bacterium]